MSDRTRHVDCYLEPGWKLRGERVGLKGNWSRLFQQAAEREILRREQLGQSREHKLPTADETVVLTGHVLLRNETRHQVIYVTVEGTVVGHDDRKLQVRVFGDPDTELQDWLIERDYREVMRKLGRPPIRRIK